MYKFFLFCYLSLIATDCVARNYESMYGKEPIKDSSVYDINQNCLDCKYEYKKENYDYSDLNLDYSKKTVGKDGTPLWDEFVSHYKYKDYNDNFSPSPYDYSINIEKTTLDEALNPSKPKKNIWEKEETKEKQIVSMFSSEINNVNKINYKEEIPEIDYFCPFETEFECIVWNKKPQVNEIVTTKSPNIRKSKIDNILFAIKENKDINARDEVFEPLIDRYKVLMRTARTCCTEGMIYKLKEAGASSKLIYKFLFDDANFYNIGNRCLMMSDKDLDEKFSNTETSNVVADVRNKCLCKGRDWLKFTLAPFIEIYKKEPNFINSDFIYSYTDGLNRKITISINKDINNILNQLNVCP